MSAAKTTTLQPIPYLAFDGNCAEAMRYYEKVLGGTITVMMTNGRSPAAEHFPKEFHDKIMHARLALLRNGIARLWWYGHLTHDRNRADPYELTAVLLSYLDIAKVLLEVNMGRAPHVRTGFLDFIRTNGDRLGNGGRKRDRIRGLAKMLNMRGGVTLLDCLDQNEVTAMLDEEMQVG